MNQSNTRPEDPNELRDLVSKSYGEIAERTTDSSGAAETARRIGYAEEQLEAVPEGANLGVGCGNPTAIDSLAPGEVVVDLGCGAGMDSFLAARAVGPEGQVIGIDMTDAMLEKARANAPGDRRRERRVPQGLHRSAPDRRQQRRRHRGRTA